MGATIQIKRGAQANLPALLPGQLAFTTDTHNLYVGQASGGNWLVTGGGPPGAMGPAGPTGAAGTAGANGAPGTNGESGAPGSQIYVGSGAPSTAQGLDGDLYLNSATGDVYKHAAGSWGSPAANIKGPQGIQGQAGATGAQGATGNTGAAGATGAQGSIGATGANGTNGAAATVAVGTTTTLAPSSSATVTNSGTTSAAVLNFGLPQGAAGTGGSASSPLADGLYNFGWGSLKSKSGVVQALTGQSSFIPTKPASTATLDSTKSGSGQIGFGIVDGSLLYNQTGSNAGKVITVKNGTLGTLTGNAAFGTLNGLSGVNFDGTGSGSTASVVDFGATPSWALQTNISVAVLLTTNVNTANYSMWLFASLLNGYISPYNNWALYYSTTALFIGTSGTNRQIVTASGSSPSTGTPHLLVGTFDGANLKVYQDGALLGTTALSGGLNTATGSRLVLGGNNQNSGGTNFIGLVDSFLVWGRAISATEISNLNANYYAPWTAS